MNKFEYKNLTPFKWFVLENFPFIEADFDALTEWQLFGKLGKEINKIINSENTLGTQVENVTNAFIELQNFVNNYFDNLDVQEEINNKLNNLVNDGTLQKLITPYFENLTNEVNNLEITKRNKSDLIGMNDLTQEVKEAMTGGSVAVIGKQSVTNATVQDFAISPNKLNFVEVQNNNLVDMSLVNNYYYKTNGEIIENGNYVSTEFIQVGEYTPGETIWRSNLTNGGYILFDENKEFIQFVATTKQLIIPLANVSYIKMNILKSIPHYDNIYLCKGTSNNYIINKLKKPTHFKNNSILVPTENLIGNSILPENTSFIEHITNNLFNKNFINTDGYFNNSGMYDTNESGNLTEYVSEIMELPIYIPNETVFYQGNGIGFINFYDINFNWIGGLTTPNTSHFTIPYNNAVYITKSLRKSEVENYYLIQGTNKLIDYYRLRDNIQVSNINNSKLYNKIIGYLGDSITYGLGVSRPYPTVIAENSGSTSINYGISGNSIAKAGKNAQENAQKNPMCIRYANMDNNLDYIVVFGGTNDYAYQIPLGDENSNNIETFNGALNTLITGLIEKYPGKPILFLTPLYRNLTLESGYKFMEYVNAIKNRCAYYSIPYFNLTDRSTIKSLIDTINDMYYVNGDRLHPNNAGQEIIARIIQNQIELI